MCIPLEAICELGHPLLPHKELSGLQHRVHPGVLALRRHYRAPQRHSLAPPPSTPLHLLSPHLRRRVRQHTGEVTWGSSWFNPPGCAPALDKKKTLFYSYSTILRVLRPLYTKRVTVTGHFTKSSKESLSPSSTFPSSLITPLLTKKA